MHSLRALLGVDWKGESYPVSAPRLTPANAFAPSASRPNCRSLLLRCCHRVILLEQLCSTMTPDA